MCVVCEVGPDELKPMDRWSRMFVADVGLILHWTLSIRWEFFSIANRDLPLAVSMKVPSLAPEPTAMKFVLKSLMRQFGLNHWLIPVQPGFSVNFGSLSCHWPGQGLYLSIKAQVEIKLGPLEWLSKVFNLAQAKEQNVALRVGWEIVFTFTDCLWKNERILW